MFEIIKGIIFKRILNKIKLRNLIKLQRRYNRIWKNSKYLRRKFNKYFKEVSFYVYNR